MASRQSLRWYLVHWNLFHYVGLSEGAEVLFVVCFECVFIQLAQQASEFAYLAKGLFGE